MAQVKKRHMSPETEVALVFALEMCAFLLCIVLITILLFTLVGYIHEAGIGMQA